MRVLMRHVLRAARWVFGVPDFRLYALADGIKHFLFSQSLGGSRNNIDMRFLMLGTVRTSICKYSDEGIDNRSCEWEGDRLDELPLALDEDPPVMRGERGRDVLPFQFSADEIFGAVELDAAVTVDLAGERHTALSDGKNQVTAGIDVGIERESVRERAEGRPDPIAKDSREPGPVVGEGEASAGLLDVVVAKEAVTRPAQHPQIGTAVKKDAFLLEAVKAFHRGVASRLSRRDEEKVDAQQKMEPDDLGEAVTIPPSSRRGHLVVHLRDPGQPHKAAGINEMATERDRLLIGELAGRGCLPDDIDGVERIEAGDAPRPPQVSGSDQVGLLEVAHPASSDVEIWGAAGKALALDIFRFAGPGQNLFDGRDGGKPTDAPSLELEMDRLGADAGESRPSALMDRQLVAKRQDLTDERLSSPIADMLRGTTLITKSGKPMFSISSEPFGKPEATPTYRPKNIIEADSSFVKLNGLVSDLIIVPAAHRLRLLPNGLGRSLSDDQITYRCPYGFLHIDVLTETP